MFAARVAALCSVRSVRRIRCSVNILYWEQALRSFQYSIQFCDSGDVEISENEFLVAVRAALKLHHEACAASMSSSNF